MPKLRNDFRMKSHIFKKEFSMKFNYRSFAFITVFSLTTTIAMAGNSTATTAAIVKPAADSGAAFMQQNGKRKDVVTLPSGLQYQIVKGGSGALPSAGATYTVNYEGKLIDGTVFDSSYKRGEPLTFQLDNVIPGWQQALPMMRPGAEWMLYIPANLAYGDQGVGSIPPNSPLIFKVQLISAK